MPPFRNYIYIYIISKNVYYLGSNLFHICSIYFWWKASFTLANGAWTLCFMLSNNSLCILFHSVGDSFYIDHLEIENELL